LSYFSKQMSSRPIKYQNLSYAGSASVPSTNFNSECFQIRVVSDLAGYLVIGDGTAVSATAAERLNEDFGQRGRGIFCGNAWPDGCVHQHQHEQRQRQHYRDGLSCTSGHEGSVAAIGGGRRALCGRPLRRSYNPKEF
jgi:hypothetical protein